MSCCPDDFTGGFGIGIECLDNGWEVVAPTPDYLHLCDYFGIEGTGSPSTPLPSGSACVGFGNHFGFTEVIGICLDDPILSGTEVSVEFEFGFGDGTSNQSVSPFEMAVFLSTDCNNVSPGGAWECLENNGWTEMGTANMVGSMSSWTTGSITFTADQDYVMLAIGASCGQLSSNSNYTYHFMDDVEIVYEPDQGIMVSDIVETGDCDSGFELEIDEPNGDSYQWYLDGVAIIGETNPTLSLTHPYDLGDYQVLVNFSGGCGVSNPISFQPDLETLTLIGDIEDAICFEDPSGSIDLDIGGLNAPLDIEWSNGETTSSITNLTAGSYQVTLTDANGCFGISTFVVDEPTMLDGNLINITHPTSGGTVGSATVNGVDGTPPYMYLWDNGETTEIATDLTPGIHTVTITDANGCVFIMTVVINEPLEFDAGIVQGGCFNECTGSINIAVTGGAPNFDFDWSNGGTSATIEDLCSGTYDLTITDDAGTITFGSFEIEESTEILIDETISTTICVSSNEGSIELDVLGGSPPYGFNWSNGSTNQNISELFSGEYSVTVTDQESCSIEASYVIEDYPEISVGQIVIDSDCEQGSGSILINVQTGEGPFSFLWSTGATTQNLLDIEGGIYGLTVTDTHNCVLEVSFIVNEDSDLDVMAIVTNPICPDQNTGQIELIINGGTSPYFIDWTTLGLTTEMVMELEPGVYPVVITDSNNCSWANNIEVAEPDSLILDFMITEVSCISESDGSIELLLMGGHPPYDIEWEDGSTGVSIGSLSSGSYTVSIVDSENCEYAYQFDLAEPNDISYSVIVEDITCNGTGFGSAEIQGLFDEEILWSTGETTYFVEGLDAGVLTFVIIDANGCEYFDDLEVIDFQASDTTYLFENDCDLNMVGIETSILSNQYSCDSVIITETLFQEADTLYTDAFSCDELEIGLDTIYTIASEGCDEVEFIETFLLPKDTTIIEIFTCLISEVSTSSMLEVNQFGCDSLIITEIRLDENIPELSAQILIQSDFNGYPIDCFGNETAALELDISGGTPPYVVVWADGSDEYFRDELSTGSYSVTILDANDCELETSVSVDEPMQLEIEFSIEEIACDPSASGRVEGFVTGGVQPYEWQINESGFSSNAQFDDLESGWYTITCRDANACEVSDSVELQILGELQLELGDDLTINSGESVQLEVSTNSAIADINNIQWVGENLSCLDCLIPTASPLLTSKYMLTVIDKDGCVAIDSLTIFVREAAEVINIPNIINPLSNSGNDLFVIEGLPDVASIQLSIFDRWGNRVFDSDTTNNLSWDGRMDGQLVSQGVYVYAVEFIDLDGNNEQYRGSLTVIY